MKNERLIISGIFLLSIALALLGLYFKHFEYKSKPLTPYSNSFDIFSFFGTREKPKYTIYGYLPYWSLNQVKYLQMDKLTDIAYFGLYINPDGTFKKTVETDEGLITDPGYNKWKTSEDLDAAIAAAKKYGVRFALTIIAHTDDENDEFLDCRSCWDKLLQNTENELDSKGIKDVNLNFEYAGQTDPARAQEFAEFTRFFNDSLDQKYGDSRVIVAAFADSNIENRVSSKIDLLAKYSDGIFIMAYDFHRPQSDYAGPVSPIEGKGTHGNYDITTMLKDYLAVAPPNKLILGVPYYGYNWVVEDDSEYAKRLEGNDDIGHSESETYAVIMDMISELKPEVKWDSVGHVPYFSYISPDTDSTREVYYENERSLREKYFLVRTNKFLGAGIWALGYDEGYTDLWNVLYDEFIAGSTNTSN